MKSHRIVSKSAAALLLGALASLSTQAATLYWNGTYTAGSPATYGSWHTATNWTTDAAATTPSAAVPTITDDLIFNSTPASSSVNQVGITADVFAQSLTFATTGTIRLSQNNSTRSLSLGAGGITVNSGAGGVTIGESTGSLFVDATANQTWVNNSANALVVRRLRAANTASGPVQVTLNAATAAAITFNNSLGDSGDGTKALSVVIDSAGTGAINLPNTQLTYSGGTTIKRGILRLSGNATAGTALTIGTNTVTLGNTSGADDARFTVVNSPNVTNNFAVAAGSSGQKVIAVETALATPEFSGDFVIADTLRLGSTATGSGAVGTVTISGDISGTGGLNLATVSGTRHLNVVLSGNNSFSGNTLVTNGTFTLADNAALTFYVGANGVSNKVSGAGTNAASFAGDFIFNLNGASLVNGNSWNIVDIGTLNESFASTFLVQGFSDLDNDNVWTNGAGFAFSEATGVLTYAIPEPSSFAALAGLGALGAVALRRRRRS